MRALILVGLLSVGIFSDSKAGPPETPVSPVTDVYHGVEVIDNYRWLEDWNDPRVRSWSEAQNGYARSILDNLPSVKELRERITEIMHATSASYYSLAWRNGTLFAMKRQPPLQQPLLVAMPSANEPEAERTVVDLNKIDSSGATSIDWYGPSPDGRFLAVSLSVRGSEVGDVHIYERSSGKDTGEVIRRVNGGTAGGDLAWTKDGSGFFYTRYPRPGERSDEDLNFYQQVWFHRIGESPDSDRYEIGRDFPRIAEIRLETDPPSGRVLATVQDGDSGRFAHYIREPDGAWKQITTYGDQIVQAIFGHNGALFLISRRNAPRGTILRLSLADPSLAKADTVVAEGEDTIVSSFWEAPMVATQTRLYVTYQLGGPSEVRVYDHGGRWRPGPAALPVSRVGQIVPLEGDDILFRNESYIDSPAWYRFSPADESTSKTALAMKSPVDFHDTEVVREYATSRDGTRIPVNIIRRKNIRLDGSNPVLLNGYGGFGISSSPYFTARRRVWIEQGVVTATANLRGGGEFGEEWHRAGMLTHKQNVFDDFAAVMKHMIDAGYTKPEKLAIMGGSNGGLLMGAMITQHPHLFRATVSGVGIYDMLRVELSPNGAFNIPEYGTVKDPEHFRAMYAYSPYHRVKDGTAYPAALFMTGANDPRVDPMQSRKMIARLQAATSSNAPILLRTDSATGHGLGTPLSKQIGELVDTYAFLFHELETRYKPVAKPAGAREMK